MVAVEQDTGKTSRGDLHRNGDPHKAGADGRPPDRKEVRSIIESEISNTAVRHFVPASYGRRTLNGRRSWAGS